MWLLKGFSRSLSHTNLIRVGKLGGIESHGIMEEGIGVKEVNGMEILWDIEDAKGTMGILRRVGGS